MFKSSISIAVLHLLLLVSFGGAYTLPPVVQMGGAIVAAVEQDAEQEAAAEERQRVERHWLSMAETQLHSLITDDLSTEEVNNMLETWSTEGGLKSSSSYIESSFLVHLKILFAFSLTYTYH